MQAEVTVVVSDDTVVAEGILDADVYPTGIVDVAVQLVDALREGDPNAERRLDALRDRIDEWHDSPQYSEEAIRCEERDEWRALWREYPDNMLGD